MRFLRSTSVLLALLTGAACAGGMDDVNRVQPNHYDKSMFTGTWHMQQTVVEAPLEAFWTFEGQGNNMAKIRWEIQENFLIAYGISDPIPGANDPASGAPSYHPVASWPITKHFDIIREYNAATGEESNVIVENSSDRPWYERQYIRVDWGSSATMSDYVFDHELTRMRMSGANHWIQPHEETDPDAAEISDDYISIVNAFDARIPYGWCWALFGDNPVIAWYDNGITEPCGPAMVRVRTSFAKVDPEREQSYQSLNYLDQRRQLAPVDLNGDQKVDDEDTLDSVLEICADLSEREDGGLFCSHFTTVPCTDEVLDRLASDPFYSQNFAYTKDDCEPSSIDYNNRFPYFRTSKIGYDREYAQNDFNRRYLINRHDIWEESVRDGEVIPYEEREPKAIVYYLNADYPEDMYDAAFEVGRQWDEVFRETVATLQDKNIEEVGTMFEVRPNSCSPDNLRSYISKNKKAKKIADRVIGGIDNLEMDNIKNLCAALQYNLGFQWEKMGDVRYNFIYMVNQPHKFGPLGYGPSSSDPDTGEIISASAYVYGAALDRSAALATDIVLLMTGRLSEAQVLQGDQILDSVRRAERLKAQARNSQPSASFFKEFDRRMSVYRNKPFEEVTRTRPSGEIDAQLERLKAYGVDKLLLPDGGESILPPQFDPSMTYDEALAHQGETSLFDLISPKKIAEREEIQMLKGKHYCMLDEGMIDNALIGLALDFDARGPDGKPMSREEIFRKIREQIFVGVMLHEVGHTLGLRHNFAASMDGINYADELWDYLELPEDPATAAASADDEVAQRLERCIERATDLDIPVPTTLECLRANELKQASVMDYGGKFNDRFRGLGKYDKAAIAFGYGGLIEVFSNREAIDGMEYDPSTTSFATHYKRLPEAFGGVENMLARDWIQFEEHQQQQAYDAILRGSALPVISVAQGGCVENCDTETSEVEVPYESCTDEWVGSSMKCHRWDTGGSQEEVMDTIINDYESYYPIHGFRRGRTNWNPFNYVYRLQNDFIRGTRMFQYYYYFNHVWRDTAFAELDLVKDFQIASAKALNLLGRVMQTPASGPHCKSPEGYYTYVQYQADLTEACELDAEGNPVEFMSIPLGVGRPQWYEYTDTRPHYQIETIGSYFERMQALLALTWSSSPFRQETGDPRTFVIGFNKAFEDEVSNLIGSVAIADMARYGAAWDDQLGMPDYRPLVDLESFGLARPPEDTRDIISAPFSFQGSELALLYGMIFLTSSQDAVSEFRNYFNLVVKGSDEDFELPSWVDTTEEEEYIEFVNPYSGVIYRSFAHPVSPQNSFGHRALVEARDFVRDEWQPAKDAVDAAKKAWETAMDTNDPTADDLYEVYLEADNEYRAVSFDLNEKLELIDRIRFWYSITKLGR